MRSGTELTQFLRVFLPTLESRFSLKMNLCLKKLAFLICIYFM